MKVGKNVSAATIATVPGVGDLMLEASRAIACVGMPITIGATTTKEAAIGAF